jgi:hypothetical protein
MAMSGSAGLFIGGFLGIVLGAPTGGPLRQTVDDHARPSRVFRSEFRYTILSNKVEDRGGAVRDIEVLLDDKAFSEATLTKLFTLLLKRYPEPAWMEVGVVTSLYQVATPEEEERTVVISGTDDHPEYDKHDHALLMRHGPNVFYRYAVGLGSGSVSWKTVVLKGCDSATSQCADGTQRWEPLTEKPRARLGTHNTSLKGRAVG